MDKLIGREREWQELDEAFHSNRSEYEITKDYVQRLNERRNTFSAVTGISHGLMDTFVTPFGIKRGVNSSGIVSQITGKDLFSLLL